MARTAATGGAWYKGGTIPLEQNDGNVALDTTNVGVIQLTNAAPVVSFASPAGAEAPHIIVSGALGQVITFSPAAGAKLYCTALEQNATPTDAKDIVWTPQEIGEQIEVHNTGVKTTSLIPYIQNIEELAREA